MVWANWTVSRGVEDEDGDCDGDGEDEGGAAKSMVGLDRWGQQRRARR